MAGAANKTDATGEFFGVFEVKIVTAWADGAIGERQFALA
jgi:hypothetical protein